jgi:thymidylate synthase (FAD)
MQVDYVNHMGDDLMVVNSARVSFNKHSEQFIEQDEKLINYLAKHGHWTPFAHPQITLRLKTPVFVRTQLFKHKVGFTENEVSRRYVNDAPDFYIPTEWRGKSVNGAKQGSSDVVALNIQEWCESEYEGIYQHIQIVYNEMIEKGVAPEQARMILPQSMYTEWYWTGSLAAYARMCKQRLDPHAQKETRDIAVMISNIIEPLFPVCWRVLID